MATAFSPLQAVMTGNPEQRVEALRLWLGYPIKQRDPEKNLFWYLRPGADDDAASETRPVAVGFYSELNDGSDAAIKAWVATPGNIVSQHFFDWNDFTHQPVMYLLLPEAQQAGRVALVLPSESRQWRQRQVLTHAWDSAALLTPLGRLRQGEMELMQKVEDKPMFSVPLVEWAFYKPIATAKELAQELARVSREMEQAIPAVYAAEEANGYLKTLYESFKRELLPTLKVSADNAKDYSLADIYAQTIAYGLFTARVFSHVRDPKADFNRQDAWDKLPETNPFLRKLFQGISEQPVEALGDELADKISEVFSILRAAKMDAILSDFRQKMNREDIVIRFYEDFLAAYKPEMRERRGVYYTPEPVVSYMVRSVDILLREKFDKPLGLADPEVMILDPACGTGTFLLWIFQLIYKRFTGKEKDENPALIPIYEALQDRFGDLEWSDYVKEHLLLRIFGFELLMAPYAIAHLKLGLFLEETEYEFDSGKRLGVYLTNTLDDTRRRSETLFEEFIADEADEALGVKLDNPVMVVIGNPPYSVVSENKGYWINQLLTDYKKDLNEKKLNLDDDFIKFIRFSQWRIDQTGHGILAFISNNIYLDGITHRRMRESLVSSFDTVNILDLHGSVKKKEKAPDGSKDENVFDIQQGVGIALYTKSPEEKNSYSVNHCDLWGIREDKYSFLESKSISDIDWSSLELGPDFFFFVPKDFELQEEYFNYISMKDAFLFYGSGVKTERDKITIHWSRNGVEAVVEDFKELDEDTLRNKYNLQKDSRDWKVVKAKLDVSENYEDDKFIPILYRPFDIRQTWYSGQTRGFIGTPGYSTMQHMIAVDRNYGLITTRQTAEAWSCFITQDLCGHKSCAAYDINSLFPLYLKSDPSNQQGVIFESQKKLNLSSKFIESIMLKLGYIPSPEEILQYIYAIFHSPSYRSRYIEFLRIDYPRVPLTSKKELFRKLAGYGSDLISLHLMTASRLSNSITGFSCGGAPAAVIENPKYANGKVTINKQGAVFTGVPEEVWNFYVGGYQVCYQWLKDRKGRTLSDDDILHYQKIIVALQETIRIMQEIDDAIPAWPIE